MVAYPDQKITDTFRIVRKYDSREDAEGNCYDWYEIDSHYRTQDREPMLTAEIDAVHEQIGAVEDAACEMDEATDERLTAIEDALCELDEILNGGEI